MDKALRGTAKLSSKELEAVEKSRTAMRKKFRTAPKRGVLVHYLGKKFLVHRNVFRPHEDSKPLVQNFVVRRGEEVLDVATGSGVIAIFAAYKGARKVVGVDINPEAIKTANENAVRHGFSNIIEARLSDGLDAIAKKERFDVVTMNPPFTNRHSKDLVEATMYDEGFKLHRNFFKNVGAHLKPNGRIYITQANFGAIHTMLKLAKEKGFRAKCIGKNKIPNDPRVFYAFELKKKSSTLTHPSSAPSRRGPG